MPNESTALKKFVSFLFGLPLPEEARTVALKRLVYAVCAHIFSETAFCCPPCERKNCQNTKLISRHLWQETSDNPVRGDSTQIHSEIIIMMMCVSLNLCDQQLSIWWGMSLERSFLFGNLTHIISWSHNITQVSTYSYQVCTCASNAIIIHHLLKFFTITAWMNWCVTCVKLPRDDLTVLCPLTNPIQPVSGVSVRATWTNSSHFFFFLFFFFHFVSRDQCQKVMLWLTGAQILFTWLLSLVLAIKATHWKESFKHKHDDTQRED